MTEQLTLPFVIRPNPKRIKFPDGNHMNSELYSAIKNHLVREMYDTNISTTRVNELAESYTNLIKDLTTKYIKGAKEHENEEDITKRDLDLEIRNELLDIYHYVEARKWK